MLRVEVRSERSKLFHKRKGSFLYCLYFLYQHGFVVLKSSCIFFCFKRKLFTIPERGLSHSFSIWSHSLADSYAETIFEFFDQSTTSLFFANTSSWNCNKFYTSKSVIHFYKITCNLNFELTLAKIRTTVGAKEIKWNLDFFKKPVTF